MCNAAECPTPSARRQVPVAVPEELVPFMQIMRPSFNRLCLVILNTLEGENMGRVRFQRVISPLTSYPPPLIRPSVLPLSSFSPIPKPIGPSGVIRPRTYELETGTWAVIPTSVGRRFLVLYCISGLFCCLVTRIRRGHRRGSSPSLRPPPPRLTKARARNHHDRPETDTVTVHRAAKHRVHTPHFVLFLRRRPLIYLIQCRKSTIIATVRAPSSSTRPTDPRYHPARLPHAPARAPPQLVLLNVRATHGQVYLGAHGSSTLPWQWSPGQAN